MFTSRARSSDTAKCNEHAVMTDVLLMVREAMVAKAAMMTAREGAAAPVMASASQPHRL